ncbi:MAG: xylulokinase [Acidobacteriota bacterium]
MAIFLGFDSSTQSLSVIAIEVEGSSGRVLLERAWSFDERLPAYGTRHGVLPSEDPRIAEAPPLMWAEAMDMAMGELSASGLDLSRIRAVSGSAQQHGSVYLAADAAEHLARLDSARPLADQMRGLFTRASSPIWMDSSTAAECADITRSVGGPAALAALTGSRAFERFTGPQIRKFAREQPAAYARTGRIHLVSSFMASLLAGADAPIEPGDGSGMNLMDIRTRRWSLAAVAATAENLADRLPDIRDSWTVVGTLAPFWRRRHGFPAADVVAWSGDNPCSLVGTGLVREGRAAISLGTSDTIFGFMREPRPDPEGTGHVFGAPTGDYLGLTCFRNGSLARERVRDDFGLDWAGFSRALQQTPPGNRGAILLPWFEPEITPPVARPGANRFGLDERDAAANVRAVVEGQMMAMALHSRWMGVPIDTIHATGGASANGDILQVAADVFGAVVYPLAVGNSAALGAALRAWHGYQRARGTSIPWEEITAAFVRVDRPRAAHPQAERRAIYATLTERYAAREAQARRAPA